MLIGCRGRPDIPNLTRVRSIRRGTNNESVPPWTGIPALLSTTTYTSRTYTAFGSIHTYQITDFFPWATRPCLTQNDAISIQSPACSPLSLVSVTEKPMGLMMNSQPRSERRRSLACPNHYPNRRTFDQRDARSLHRVTVPAPVIPSTLALPSGEVHMHECFLRPIIVTGVVVTVGGVGDPQPPAAIAITVPTDVPRL